MRRTASFTIEREGRDKGGVFVIQEMPALPGSVRSVMEGSNSSEISVPLPEQVWLELSAQLPGVVHGRQEVSVTVK